MSDMKTRPTDADVAGYLARITDASRRADCAALAAMFTEVTGEPPVLWGTSIVGFGTFTYRTSGGKAYDWFPVGFAPRKAELTVYLASGHAPHADLVVRLGKHRTGVGCVYIKRLSDVDIDVLRELVARSWATPPTSAA